MSTDYVSYVPNGNGRFIRYSYARPSGSSNRFVELGRFFYNLIRGFLQLFNVLQSFLTTFNNMLSSLPYCIQYIIHGILAFCVPFYSVYRGSMMLMNRIYRITYPFYRAITLIARLFTWCITLPIRIVTYVTTQTQVLLINLIKFLIIASIIIGLAVLLMDEEQLNYVKSYVRNATDLILKQASMV